MNLKIAAIWTMACFAFCLPPKKKIKIFLAGDSTLANKTTRSYPETGWGMPFTYFWDSAVTVVNKAKNGASTKSFLNEGLWQSIMNEVSAGDYVIIQFGHNDEVKEKVARYTTPDTFRLNLSRLINDVRTKGATPVLFTPVSRRKFVDGKQVETHAAYSPYVKQVAEKEKVLFFDLDKRSQELYQQFGEENSTLLFLQLKPGEHPNYPAGKTDNTHFNELGARLVAQLVFKNLLEQIPQLKEYVTPGR